VSSKEETQPDLHLIVEVKVVRPVMGHVRSRFLTCLPANTPGSSPEVIV